MSKQNISLNIKCIEEKKIIVSSTVNDKGNSVITIYRLYSYIFNFYGV